MLSVLVGLTNIRDYIHRLVDDYKERGSRGGGVAPTP
jgi:hypothetical protein